MTNKSFKILIVAAIGLVAILFIPNWKTSKAEPDNKIKKSEMPPAQSSVPTLSEEAFVKSVFAELRAPDYVVTAVTEKDSSQMREKAIKWAMETNNPALYYYLNERDLNKKSSLEDITAFSRDAIFYSASIPDPGQSQYLANLGKKWLDKGLEINPKHIPLLNALIIYQSEFMNQPMQFLATLRKTLAIDSLNEETNFIHINLLKKSGQLDKAIEKCKKLVSLQPQNSIWLEHLSDVYGMKGDSMNAKLYLDLAIKQRRTKNFKE